MNERKRSLCDKLCDKRADGGGDDFAHLIDAGNDSWTCLGVAGGVKGGANTKKMGCKIEIVKILQ